MIDEPPHHAIAGMIDEPPHHAMTRRLCREADLELLRIGDPPPQGTPSTGEWRVIYRQRLGITRSLAARRSCRDTTTQRRRFADSAFGSVAEFSDASSWRSCHRGQRIELLEFAENR
jgi:hypothetical protein